MSPWVRAALVAMGSYALVSTTASALVAIAWRLGLARVPLSASHLFALRVFPAVAGAGLAIGVVLPSFLRFEPPLPGEEVGPVARLLAFGAAVLLGHAALRAWRAIRATRAATRAWLAAAGRHLADGTSVHVVETATPVVAVVGVRRPRIVMARCVVSACTAEEIARVTAHERAHLEARDNVKRLVLAAAPDVLAWLPAGTALAARWHRAAEHAADDRAAGAERAARLALASALLKVARLAVTERAASPVASGFTGADGIEERVRRLVDAAPAGTAGRGWHTLAATVALPPLAVPLHSCIHALAEALVALGR